MDEFISSLTSLFGPAFLVLCVVIYILVELQRKILKLFFSKRLPVMLKDGTWQNKLWREILSPSAAPGTGMIFTWLVTSYPYPEIFTTSTPNRIAWGIFSGFFSEYVYRMAKQLFSGYIEGIAAKYSKKNNKNNKDNESVSLNPPSSSEQ